jgi:hypothetical protein
MRLMHSSRALLLGALLLVTASAGCTGRGDDGIGTGGDIVPPTVTTPTTTTPATGSFQIAQLAILSGEGTARALYEDDQAIIRYVIAQPAESGRSGTAFVTYILNGQIVDVQQMTLAAGEEKTFERKLADLRDDRALKVEVRAGSAIAKAEASVLAWPRAGEGELVLGPMAIRVPYGLMEMDGRVLVNLSLDHRGPEQTFRDLRVKMLCLSETGEIRETHNERIAGPTLGNSTGVDVFLANCSQGFYGLEFKADDDAGEIMGRMLLVSTAWRPPQE